MSNTFDAMFASEDPYQRESAALKLGQLERRRSRPIRLVAWMSSSRVGYGAWHVRVDGERTACGIDVLALRNVEMCGKTLESTDEKICETCRRVAFPALASS